MKTITIGRGDGADICIDDELVSRRHATIRISPWGKIEIRDFSKNGTYVNGIRLAMNKPYPITRKDVVSFARVRQLDWSEVPDPTKPYKIGAIALLAVIVALVAFSLLSRIDWGGTDKTIPRTEESAEPTPEKQDEEKAEDSKDKQDVTDGKKAALPDLFPKDKDKGKDKKKDKEKGKEEPKGDKKSGNEKEKAPSEQNPQMPWTMS